jgi:hypothetical protein
LPFFIIEGLEISVLHAVHNLLKDKSARMHMWKGEKKTNKKSVGEHYLKVSVQIAST